MESVHQAKKVGPQKESDLLVTYQIAKLFVVSHGKDLRTSFLVISSD